MGNVEADECGGESVGLHDDEVGVVGCDGVGGRVVEGLGIVELEVFEIVLGCDF